MDVFAVDLVSNNNQNSLHSGSIGSEGEGSKTEEDYMELYVAKELKDKLTPIEENLTERKAEFDELNAKVAELEKRIEVVDKHYNGCCKAILTRHGVILQEISEYNILKELQRIKHKEEHAKKRIKRETTSISPEGREGSPRNKQIDAVTSYVTKLAPIANIRKFRQRT